MKTINLKPCPFCGSKNIIFTANHQHGHGDMGYTDARYVCMDCIAAKGQSDYGMTNNAVQERAANAWNMRGGVEAEPVKIEVEESEEDEVMRKLIEKYQNISFFDFMELFMLTDEQKRQKK